jgi:hypothetical protein|tara:strand:- start:453 stop:701 length:249 start_codon:yes stop_codon:yes gene_type:complete
MEGIYVWVITAMLSYGSAGVIAYDKEVTELIFEDDGDCHQYIFDQKVLLADDLLAEYRVVDGENLTGFDFLCETRFIQTEEV